jgi:hypothetical protein
MTEETRQTVEVEKFFSDQLADILSNVNDTDLLRILFVVKKTEGLDGSLADSQAELMKYLRGRGIDSMLIGKDPSDPLSSDCPWFVAATMTKIQIYSLSSDYPIKKIVPGNGLEKFVYRM